MKPHDQWNSTDIADYARRAEQYDFGADEAKRNTEGAILAFVFGALFCFAMGVAVGRLW